MGTQRRPQRQDRLQPPGNVFPWKRKRREGRSIQINLRLVRHGAEEPRSSRHQLCFNQRTKAAARKPEGLHGCPRARLTRIPARGSGRKLRLPTGGVKNGNLQARRPAGFRGQCQLEELRNSNSTRTVNASTASLQTIKSATARKLPVAGVVGGTATMHTNAG